MRKLLEDPKKTAITSEKGPFNVLPGIQADSCWRKKPGIFAKDDQSCFVLPFFEKKTESDAGTASFANVCEGD